MRICKHGHPRTPENVDPWGHCRTCQRIRLARPENRARNSAYYAAHRDEIQAQHAEYRAAHLEEERAFGAAYRAVRRDELRAWHVENNATLRHGISRVVRNWMYESQDEACAGCRTPIADADLEIDHDHNCCPGKYSCGRCVRGLLCRACNARDVLAEVFS